jgi:hypothetical protein
MFVRIFQQEGFPPRIEVARTVAFEPITASFDLSDPITPALLAAWSTMEADAHNPEGAEALSRAAVDASRVAGEPYFDRNASLFDMAAAAVTA